MDTSEYIKLSDLLPNGEIKNITVETNLLSTVQLQPQPQLEQTQQQIKLVVIGKRGCIKNYINSFEIFENIHVKIYELLNDEVVIIESLRTNNKIPILELTMPNNIRLYFAFTADKVYDFTTVHNVFVSGKLTLELYSDIKPLRCPQDYQYTDKKKLLEDLIEYLFTHNQDIIHYCKC